MSSCYPELEQNGSLSAAVGAFLSVGWKCRLKVQLFSAEENISLHGVVSSAEGITVRAFVCTWSGSQV